MNNSNTNIDKLAIVIPAYKKEYFDETLFSIANQTNKNFTLYIGDDASPYDLYSIVSNYEDKIEIVYKRFNENLGSISLVKQWERCIDLVDDENWIWLFSDDDIMEHNCVESFYNIKDKAYNILYRFNIKEIDNNSQLTGRSYSFPPLLSTSDFINKRLSRKLLSFVVEYIFNKNWFCENGRFQEFDLAWGSDDATWIKLSRLEGIETINNGIVKWRDSGLNISSVKDKETVIRKINSKLEYIKWLTKFCDENNIRFSDKKFLLGYLHGIKSKLQMFNIGETLGFIKNYFKDENNFILQLFGYNYLLFFFFYARLKVLFK